MKAPVGAWGHEGFSVFGAKASFIDSFGQCRWITRDHLPETFLAAEEMRDPLPAEVAAAFRDEKGETAYGGHGGSHGYLADDFTDAILRGRKPAVDVIDALNMTVPGYYAHLSAMKDGGTLRIPQFSLTRGA